MRSLSLMFPRLLGHEKQDGKFAGEEISSKERRIQIPECELRVAGSLETSKLKLFLRSISDQDRERELTVLATAESMDLRRLPSRHLAQPCKPDAVTAPYNIAKEVDARGAFSTTKRPSSPAMNSR